MKSRPTSRIALSALLIVMSVMLAGTLFGGNGGPKGKRHAAAAPKPTPADTSLTLATARLAGNEVRNWYCETVVKSEDSMRQCESGVVYRFTRRGRLDIDSCIGGTYMTRTVPWRMRKPDSLTVELMVGGARYRVHFSGKDGSDTMLLRSMTDAKAERIYWAKSE
jgi:hypothetical protein